MSYRVGIVAALPGELKPLVRGWTRHADGVYQWQQGSVTALALAGGMGAENAARALEKLASHGALDALVSTGWAGATTCGVQPATAYEIDEVIDELTGERLPTASDGTAVKLITSARILGRQEKRSHAEHWRVSFVDMEAATVARAAQQQQLPFYCWKALTDSSTEDLPDLNQFVVNDELQMPRLVTYVLLHPRYLRAMMRMGQNSRTGADALARTVQQWLTTIASREAATAQGNYADSHR